MNDEEAAFIATIRENPRDTTARLVYADWLEEHGNSDRGEYLRIVTEIAYPSKPGESIEVLSGKLRVFAKSIDRYWREQISFPYRVILESFDPSDLITLIRLMRMKFGFNLAESKALTVKVPSLLATVSTREEAEEIKSKMEAGYWSHDPSGAGSKPRSIPLCCIRIEPAFDS